MNYIKDKGRNLKYQFFNKKQAKLLLEENQKKLYLLGQQFVQEKEEQKLIEKEVEELINKIPWFCYRKNFDEIKLQDQAIGLNSDSGWGCMIRAGQNVLFLLIREFLNEQKEINDVEILRKFFNEKNQTNLNDDDQEFKPHIENQSKFETELKISKILVTEEKTEQKTKSCLDLDNSQFQIFSLQNFVLQAEKYFDKIPGQWFRPTTFVMSLEKILSVSQKFEGLNIVNMLDNILYVQELNKAAFNNPLKFDSEEKTIDHLLSNEWQNKVILSISTILGLNKTDLKYKPILDQFLQLKSNRGFLGGENSAAYFIVGFNGDNEYYYLDPHYVKQSRDLQKQKNEEILSDFFNKKLLQISYEQLNYSISLIFYLQNREDFKEFLETFKNLEQNLEENFFLCMMNEQEEIEFDQNDLISF